MTTPFRILTFDELLLEDERLFHEHEERLRIAEEWLRKKTSDSVYVVYEAVNLVAFQEYLLARKPRG